MVKSALFRMTAAAPCLMALALLAGGARAAEWPAVEPRLADGIGYVNGGFGLEERQAMPGGYPLKLMFATERGHYLSGVDVVIHDGAGKKVFAVRADDGPWLLVKLAAGRYSLEAVHNGHRKTLPAIEVPARGTQSVLVTWKFSEVNMGLPE